MFGKRPDGRAIRNLDPMQKIMPYVMKTRTDSMNMYEDTFPCDVWDTYIKEKEMQGIKMGYMHILIVALVRLLALRPPSSFVLKEQKIHSRFKPVPHIHIHYQLKISGN